MPAYRAEWNFPGCAAHARAPIRPLSLSEADTRLAALYRRGKPDQNG
jgi:hypothetical protein